MIVVLGIHALLSSKMKGMTNHMNILQISEVVYLEHPTFLCRTPTFINANGSKNRPNICPKPTLLFTEICPPTFAQTVFALNQHFTQ